MTDIILCDLKIENIKIIMEHISSLKNKKIKYIASNLEDICFYFLSNNNYIFMINTDYFPKESFDLITGFQGNNLIFYTSKTIHEAKFYQLLESFKTPDNPLTNIEKKFESLNFNFFDPGTTYLIDFVNLFSNIFNKETNSFKYIFPYIALKYNSSPNAVLLSSINSLKNMYFTNNLPFKVIDYPPELSIDYPYFQNIFIDFINFLNK